MPKTMEMACRPRPFYRRAQTRPCCLHPHPPTSPCPALSAVAEPISQGHCRKSHDEAESIMMTFGAIIMQSHLYKLVRGLSTFPNSPITFSHTSIYITINIYTRSNHNLSLHVSFSHSNFLCEAPHTWNLLPYSVTSSSRLSLNSFKRNVSGYNAFYVGISCAFIIRYR